MAINSYIISELFPERMVQKLTSSKYQFPIRYATIYNPLLRIKSDAVYLVVNPGEFPKEHVAVKSTFLVFGMLKEEILQQTEHDVICLSRESALGKIYETLLEQMERYERWEASMNRILLDGGSIEEICQVSLPFLDNPIFVASGDFRVLATAQTKHHPFGWKIQSENDHLCEARILSLLSGSSTAQKFEGGHFNLTVENHVTTLRMTIASHQQVLGYVCMDDAARPFSDGDYTRLCMLQPYICRCMACSSNIQSSAFHLVKNFLSEYLSSENPNPFELRKVLSSMGWKNHDSYVCCVIHIRFQQERQYVGNYLCGYIEHHIPGLVTIQKDDKIYVLCNWSCMTLEEAQWTQYLEQISTDYGVPVGISTLFDDSAELLNYFQQAEAALLFCGGREHQIGIYRFEEYRLPFLLKKGLDALPLETLLTPELRRFLEEDSESQYENYKILRSYIRNNLNISETTAELFLHRSSLIYRLDKIKRMLGSDLTQKEEQLYLRLLFYAIDSAISEKNEVDLNEIGAPATDISQMNKAG